MGPDLARPSAGFGEGFAHEHEHEIFCEHAALSGFENDGSRQFDISGLAGLTRAEFEVAPALARQRRLAQVGGIACSRTGALPPGWPGPPAAPGPALPEQPETPRLRGLSPLLLNSGRLRDQWHTMTRTGHALLQEAEPWPRVRMGAASLLALGAREGDLVRLCSRLGRRCCWWGWDEGPREGEAFLPCTGPTASAARGGQPSHRPPWWIPFGPADVQAGRCRPGRSPPAGRALARRGDWREGGLAGQAPLPEGNCTLLASWSESPERLWQRLGPRAPAQAAHEGGWLAVALAGDRIEGILLMGSGARTSRSICWPACSARRSRWGPLSQTLSQALAGRAGWSAPACGSRSSASSDAITRQGVSWRGCRPCSAAAATAAPVCPR